MFHYSFHLIKLFVSTSVHSKFTSLDVSLDSGSNVCERFDHMSWFFLLTPLMQAPTYLKLVVS